MFKLIVLSALFALAAAKPSLLAPTLLAAPSVTKIVQPAPLVVSQPAHVGSVISSVPTGVSAYSSSVVHGGASVVHSHVSPVVHKTIVAPVVHAPVVHAPLLKTYAAPAYHYASPLAYGAYGAHLW